MKKIITTISILLIVITCLNAQSVKKGFKMMEQNLFDRGSEAFAKVLTKSPENAGANLGLALIYFDKRYPYKDFFKAYDYMLKAEKTFKTIPADDSEIIKAYFNLREKRSSKPMIKRFEDKLYEMSDKLITDVREENNLNIAKKYLEKYPNSPYYGNIIHIRNYLEYKIARKTNTVTAYNAYLNKYPNSAQVERVTKLRDNIAFQEAKAKKSIAAINEFIKNNPKSPQLFEAIKIRNKFAFNQAKTANTIEAIESFINQYSEASQLPEAKKIRRQLVFERAKRVNTLEAYNAFVKEFPYGQYYIDIFNLKANVIGNRIKEANKYASNNIQWIKGFDNEYKNDVASAVAIGTDGSIILVGTSSQNDTLGDDAWIMKLNEQGKMIWHKTVGSLRHEKVTGIAITAANEIVMSGLFNSSTDTIDGKIWLLKLTAEGDKIWHKSFGVTEAFTIATNIKGEIIVGGYELNEMGERKLLIFKLNQNGRKLWTRVYTNIGTVNSVSTNSFGDIAVASDSRVFKLDSKGYIIWDTDMGFGNKATAVALSASGDAFVTGSKNAADIWIARYSSTGNKEWEQVFDNFGKKDIPNAICLTPSNDLLVSGQSNNDSWIIKLNENGTKIYDNFFSTGHGEILNSIALTRDGKFVVFGSQGREALNSNYILMKLIQ